MGADADGKTILVLIKGIAGRLLDATDTLRTYLMNASGGAAFGQPCLIIAVFESGGKAQLNKAALQLTWLQLGRAPPQGQQLPASIPKVPKAAGASHVVSRM